MSGVKLTKPQRALLAELSECRAYRLPRGTRRVANGLLYRGLISFRPETANLFEAWIITKAGRAALSASQPGKGE